MSTGLIAGIVTALLAAVAGMWAWLRRRSEAKTTDAIREGYEHAGAADALADEVAADTAAAETTWAAEDARATQQARDHVESIRRAPPTPERGSTGAVGGRRPRSDLADELGLEDWT